MTAVRAYRVLGMQRSGNHAIIDWLMRNVDVQPVIHYNNCKPGDPALSFADFTINGAKYKRKRSKPEELEQLMGMAKSTIASYENPPLDALLTDVGDWTPVLITRSFVNWMASFYRLRHHVDLPNRRRYPRSILFTPKFIQAYEQMILRVDQPGVVHVRYDDFLSSEEYRAGRLAALGLPVIDNSISDEGIGRSSFGAGASIDPAHLRSRWKSSAGDLGYVALMTLASMDEAFTDKVAKVYPEDAELMLKIRSGVPIAELAAQ